MGSPADRDAAVAVLCRRWSQGNAYVPFFPLGGSTPVQSAALDAIARRLETTPMHVAIPWGARRRSVRPGR